MKKKLVLAFGIVIFVIIALSWRIASANPIKCPPGQEKENGCVWAQHRVTGKCMWLPAKSVNPPWVPRPSGTCPIRSLVTATVVIIVEPTNTPFRPTNPPNNTTATKAPPNNSNPKSIPTSEDPGIGASCDYCSLVSTIAAAQATQAAAAATMAAKP